MSLSSLNWHTVVFWKMFHVLYYIKFTKFVKLANFSLSEDFSCSILYIKVTKFVKLSKFGLLGRFSCAILHKSHKVC